MMDATSRRSFLRTGALLGAGACALPARVFSEGTLGLTGFAKMRKEKARPQIRLGVASYSLRSMDRAHVIDALKQLKTTYLNAKDVKDHLPSTSKEAEEEAIAAYKAAGIQLTAAGTIYFPKADASDIEKKFQYAKRAGIGVIVGSPTKEALPDVESFVKQYDIKLAIHNHGPEDKEWPSPLDVLKGVEKMDHRVGLCIDVGHTARAGTDVVDAIRKAGPRLYCMHMKDLADMSVKESQVAVGDGKMPVRAIFEELLAIQYKGFVDLEYEIHEDDPLPGMIKSFAYMRGVLEGMGYVD
jgi:sugar phosphate isomerase/epimerase